MIPNATPFPRISIEFQSTLWIFWQHICETLHITPIVAFSDYLLVAKKDYILFTNSLGAISVLMNALVTELALTQEIQVLDCFEKVKSYLKGERYFY